MKRGLPQDPMLAQLVQMARQHQISRRAALAGVGGTAAALTLAGCSAAEEGLAAGTDVSDSEKVLVWHNWPAYMDEDDDGNYATHSKQPDVDMKIKAEELIAKHPEMIPGLKEWCEKTMPTPNGPQAVIAELNKQGMK